MDKKAAANKKGGAGSSVERKPRSASKADARSGSKRKESKSVGKEEGKRRSTSRASVGKRSASRGSAVKGKKGAAAAAVPGKKDKGGKASAQSKKVDAKKEDAKKEESKSIDSSIKLIIGKSAKKGKKAAEEEDDGKLKPSRPNSAYIFFSTEIIPKLKKDEGIAHKDAMSKAGALWNELTEEKKAPYNKLHDDDVKRYEEVLLNRH
jgi:hypothetical protein